MSRHTATSRFLRVGPAVLAALLCCAGGLAQVISQFPTKQPPIGITWGSDGAMWLTMETYRLPNCSDLGGDCYSPWLARVDSSGVITEADWFNDYLGVRSNSPLTYRVVQPDGTRWFTKPEYGRIGRITTSGVESFFYVAPPSDQLSGITAGPDGNIWFTAAAGNWIGRITISGTITKFDLPTAGSYPVGITSGPDGNVWFTEFGAPRIGRIAPSGTITEFPISGKGAFAILAGADGNLWAEGMGTLTRVKPTGSVAQYSIPTGGWDPSSLPIPTDPFAFFAAAPDGSLWIADHANSQIVRFSLDTSSCVADATTHVNGGHSAQGLPGGRGRLVRRRARLTHANSAGLLLVLRRGWRCPSRSSTAARRSQHHFRGGSDP